MVSGRWQEIPVTETRRQWVNGRWITVNVTTGYERQWIADPVGAYPYVNPRDSLPEGYVRDSPRVPRNTPGQRTNWPRHSLAAPMPQLPPARPEQSAAQRETAVSRPVRQEKHPATPDRTEPAARAGAARARTEPGPRPGPGTGYRQGYAVTPVQAGSAFARLSRALDRQEHRYCSECNTQLPDGVRADCCTCGVACRSRRSRRMRAEKRVKRAGMNRTIPKEYQE